MTHAGDLRATSQGMYEPSAFQASLPLSYFLDNNAALLYFQEFMESEQAKDLIDFFLNAETFELVSRLKLAEAGVWAVDWWLCLMV